MSTKKKKRGPSPLGAVVAEGTAMTPEQKRARDTVSRIDALFSIAKIGNSAPMLRFFPWYDDMGFRWLDFGEREPNESFAIHREGRVVRHTWERSDHNGGSYANKYEELVGEAVQNALDSLVVRLEGLALAAEERRLEEAEKRRKAGMAKKSLQARLRTMGIV